MNMESLSIYLVLCFLLLEFYTFSHIDLLHILLDLYISISIFRCYVNDNMF